MSPCVAKEPFHGVGTTIGKWSQSQENPWPPPHSFPTHTLQQLLGQVIQRTHHTQYSNYFTTQRQAHTTGNDTHTRPILFSYLRLRSRTQLSALESFNLNFIVVSSILLDQRV
jgi:hypothetical protein